MVAFTKHFSRGFHYRKLVVLQHPDFQQYVILWQPTLLGYFFHTKRESVLVSLRLAAISAYKLRSL